MKLSAEQALRSDALRTREACGRIQLTRLTSLDGDSAAVVEQLAAKRDFREDQRLMPLNIGRVARVAHYVIARTEPSELGYVKLNKILWYADLESYRRHGVSLTGLERYTRMPQGPMSKDISRAVRLLRKEGKITERPVKVIDYARRELIWLKEPDLSDFTAEQIDLLNQLIDLIVPLTADQVSKMTHDDSLWSELKNNDLMAIGPGSIIARPPRPRELDWALAQVR